MCLRFRFHVVLVLLVASCGGGAAEERPTQGPLWHRFRRADDWAGLWDAPSRDVWQKPAEVVALMQIAPGSTVADLGAGTGYFEPHLSRAVGAEGTVLALDIEADMVRHMRERFAREGLANAQARLVAFDDPGLAPGSVDRVLIVNTWHHIPDRARYVGKLVRGLREGGAVVVVDYTLESPHGPARSHKIPPAEVVGELQAGGLSVEILEETLPDQYVVVGRR